MQAQKAGLSIPDVPGQSAAKPPKKAGRPSATPPPHAHSCAEHVSVRVFVLLVHQPRRSTTQELEEKDEQLTMTYFTPEELKAHKQAKAEYDAQIRAHKVSFFLPSCV